MKFPKSYTLKEISQIINSKYIGADDFSVKGMNEIHVVEEGDIVFVDHPKYYDKALNSKATIILINKEVACPEGKALLLSNDPFRDFNKLTNYFKPFVPASSAISDSAKIGEGTIIQPNTFLGNNVSIGENCIVHSNVAIYDNCVIGNNVTIHAGSVLGADAFYYKNRPEGFDKLRSGGRVVLEDNVDIGAGTTIDRATMGSTILRKGVKLDNQIQIAHNVEIGKNTVIAAQTGIAGSTKIGKNCQIGGQVGIAGHLNIGNSVRIQAQSGIGRNIKDNETLQGSPSFNYADWNKSYVYFKNLPKIVKNISEIEKKINGNN